VRRAALAALLLVAACSSGDDEAATTTTATAGDPSTTTTTTSTTTAVEATGPYAGTENWICHPDRDGDTCDDLATTVVAADGTRTVDQLEPADDPAADCFYVYPTTSTDPGANADLVVDESEVSTVRAQFARWATVCRAFAPAYRQVTLAGIFGAAGPEARELAYADVVDAWEAYLQQSDRPVVLVGHSQGAGLLTALLADGHVPADRLVAAYLLGSGYAGESPLCEAAEDTGCVVSFASFPADQPPGDDAIFGRTRDGEQAACVDPVALVGEDTADAVLPANGVLFGAVEELGPIDTPFVAFPDSLRVACQASGGRAWLAVEQVDPADPRPVARLLRTLPSPTWGTHLFDANLAQDDLIALAAGQIEAAG
jgi:pimeloyl-ACP methyl ester carboxylesterase